MFNNYFDQNKWASGTAENESQRRRLTCELPIRNSKILSFNEKVKRAPCACPPTSLVVHGQELAPGRNVAVTQFTRRKGDAAK